MPIPQERLDHGSIHQRLSTLLYAHDTKYIDSFVKTLPDDYKLTLNDPDPIDYFLGIHFSHQDNGELHMSQTGLIDAATVITHTPKG
jgi:hypothetical protein